MKRLVLVVLFVLPLPVLAEQQVVEIDIAGMTCPFCVYGVQKNLSRLPGVEQCDVSLKHKKARIVMASGVTPEIERIRKVILDAGFTPGEAIQTLDD